ncbi:IS66 family insertion sequence element accessory protein TnpB [Cupriavidus sp. LEh25]|uniref:IS66 family insertion sequence element accessory protein TnpB n=1 Tax=Cupriavidus consociatus TaxID=2821357 RepID=UPI001AE62E30|nr:IS66 family insertion sequence element accessory protein TnpB [Cupriavidus sp. LEh25]
MGCGCICIATQWDFRKNINGLALLVEQALGPDPFASAVFVFRNEAMRRHPHREYHRAA